MDSPASLLLLGFPFPALLRPPCFALLSQGPPAALCCLACLCEGGAVREHPQDASARPLPPLTPSRSQPSSSPLSWLAPSSTRSRSSSRGGQLGGRSRTCLGSQGLWPEACPGSLVTVASVHGCMQPRARATQLQPLHAPGAGRQRTLGNCASPPLRANLGLDIIRCVLYYIAFNTFEFNTFDFFSLSLFAAPAAS